MKNRKTNVVLNPEYTEMARIVIEAHPEWEGILSRTLRQCLRLEYERLVKHEPKGGEGTDGDE